MRNPFRRRWAVIAQGQRGARWVAALTWTRAGAQIIRTDLETADHEVGLALLQSGIATWTSPRISYLIGRADQLEGPWT